MRKSTTGKEGKVPGGAPTLKDQTHWNSVLDNEEGLGEE